MPQYLKYLAAAPYEIYIPVSNYHLYSDISISQGSVPTSLKCGGIFSYHFIANLSQNLTTKEFWRLVKIW